MKFNKVVPKELVGSYIQCIMIVNVVVLLLCSFLEVSITGFQIFLNVLIADAWWWRKYLSGNLTGGK